MDLFVYGTLRSPALMAAVAGPGPLNAVPAQLDGYGLVAMASNVLPCIVPDARSSVSALVWEGLTPAQMLRLDAYKGAFGYRFGPLQVQVGGKPRMAQCYLPPDEAQAGAGSWSLAAWEADHLAPAVLAATEMFALDPLPDPASLRAMWPMIEARAWSKHRATAAPAKLRHAAQADDFRVIAARPPVGRFFRFQQVDVVHRTFAGRTSDRLVREAFFGVDAAIVLPYDPVRDRILLVEQARLGPKLRQDPNPWMLEAVAGIIDARETPQDAALREAREEAGLEIRTLLQAGPYYPSPGATTDYFYPFVGLCDLPDLAGYLGGLADEGEDLRLHVLSFDDAMALADSGEIATGPALYLLYWLLRHRDGLRGQNPD